MDDLDQIHHIHLEPIQWNILVLSITGIIPCVRTFNTWSSLEQSSKNSVTSLLLRLLSAFFNHLLARAG